jgi:hypothetical protein
MFTAVAPPLVARNLGHILAYHTTLKIEVECSKKKHQQDYLSRLLSQKERHFGRDLLWSG